jgi:hypothetical protein
MTEQNLVVGMPASMRITSRSAKGPAGGEGGLVQADRADVLQPGGVIHEGLAVVAERGHDRALVSPGPSEAAGVRAARAAEATNALIVSLIGGFEG